METTTRSDVLAILDYNGEQVICPCSGCDWSAPAAQKTQFLHHYFEHRALVERFNTFALEIPETVDIDVYFPDTNFRMERMSDDTIWLATYDYPIDEGTIDIHYDLFANSDGISGQRRIES